MRGRHVVFATMLVGCSSAHIAQQDAGTDAGARDAGPPDAGSRDGGPMDAGIDANLPDAGTDGDVFFDDFEDGTLDPWIRPDDVGTWEVHDGHLYAGPSCFWDDMPCAGDEFPIVVHSPTFVLPSREYSFEADFYLDTDTWRYHLVRFGVMPAVDLAWVPPTTTTGGSYSPWVPTALMLASTGYLNTCFHCFQPPGDALWEQFGSATTFGVWYHARIDGCADRMGLEVRRVDDGTVLWFRRETFDARVRGVNDAMIVLAGEGPNHAFDNVRIRAGCRL